MTTDNLIPQTVGAGSVVTTAFTLGGGSWARRWGRAQPIHGTLSTFDLIVAEARNGLFSADLNGVAYGSETTWVRCYCVDDTGAAGDGELRTRWLGVPTALPAGYTARNNRNVGPPVGYRPGSPIVTALSVFAPTAAPATNFIRNASGLYTPKDNSNTYVWGPWNGDNLAVQNATDGSSDTQDATNNPWLVSGPFTGESSGVADTVASGLLHPGFRSIGFACEWSPQIYNPDPFYPTVSSYVVTLTASTGGSVSKTITKADLTLTNPGSGYHYSPLAQLGSLLAPVGQVASFSVTCTANFTGGGGTWPGGAAFWFYLCPRVDIPLPFTTTYGNVVAPGGILTGSIPGF